MEIKDFFNGPVTYEQRRGQGLFINAPDGSEVLICVFATFPVVVKLPEFKYPDEQGYYDSRRFQDSIGEFVARAINGAMDLEFSDAKSKEDILLPYVERVLNHTEVVDKDNALKAMEEYRKQGRFFTPDEIRVIQEQAYSAGFEEGQSCGANSIMAAE